MYIPSGIIPALAVVALVAPAQVQADETTQLSTVMERLNKELLTLQDSSDEDASKEISMLKNHMRQVLEGRETLKDYPWLPIILRCYWKDDVKSPLEIVDLLIKNGADVNATDDRGCTALFYHGGSAEMVKLLLEAGADINATEKDKETPLFYSLRELYLPALDMLIASGANVNAQDKDGDTALYRNICCGTNVVSLRLIAAGADANICNKDGVSALDVVIREGNVGLLMEMIHAGAQVDTTKYPPFFIACMYGQLDECRRLIDEGEDLDEGFNDGPTPLMLAARIGNEELCRLLLDAGADVAVESAAGDTVLHVAAEYNKPAVCKLLIDAGADVEARNERGETPLAIAVENGNDAAVDALLAAGAKINVRCDTRPLIFKACGHGNDDAIMLKKLVDAGADIKLTARGSNQMILHFAAQRNAVAVCEFALAAGVDVNAQDARGKTALGYAIRGCSDAVCRKLLAAGADVNAGKESGLDYLYSVASQHNNREKASNIWTMLLEAGVKIDDDKHKGTNLFCFLVCKRRMDQAKMLLDAGLELHEWTPLCRAVVLDSPDEVKKLLEQGASVNELTRGISALSMAAYLRNAEVCRLLVEHGATTQMLPYERVAPLTAAVLSADPAVVKLLLDHGAKPDEVHTYGQPTLCDAAALGNIEICKLLLAAGADVNVSAKMRFNNTPLHIAARRGDEALCRLLIEHGAKVNAQNDDKSTPLHAALMNNGESPSLDTPVCRLLIEKGADVNLPNDEGDSPKMIVEKGKAFYFFDTSSSTFPLFYTGL